MSVSNFIPVLWEEKILKELDKQHMLVKNCTTEWSGKISGVGSKVKINSIATPTISAYTPNSTSVSAEDLQDESRMLEITKAYYFAFYLDDVDEKQATGGLISEGVRKATIGLKDKAEAFIGGLYGDAGNDITETSLTTANTFSNLMDAKTLLMANNVSEDGMFLEVSPYIYRKMVLADIIYADNGETIRKGKFSPMLGMDVYVSNNLNTTVTSTDVVETNCLMRTKEAIAYAEQIMKVAKYMPEAKFAEAVKGLHVFGGKVIKPKELVNLDLKTAAETVI